MEIRTIISADLDRVHRLIIDAFAQDSGGEAELVSKLRQDGDDIVELVAVMKGVVVGHIMLSKMRSPIKSLGLAPVSVAPEYQRKGIGSALIITAIAQAKTSHWESIFVLGDLNYYSKFGFKENTAKPYSSPYAGPHFGAIELTKNSLQKEGIAEYAKAFSSIC